MDETTRPCGTCSQCCVLLRIDAPKLTKPVLTACPHLAAPGHGCGIYRHRPRPCRQFSCAWREGRIAERFQPSQTGIVADWYAAGPGRLGMRLYVDPEQHDAAALSALMVDLPAVYTEILVVRLGEPGLPIMLNRASVAA